MKDEYDFSNAEQGKFYVPVEDTEIPIYLDKDVVKYLTEKCQKGVAIFLRKIVLGIPAQAIGKNLTRLIIAFGAPAVLLHSWHTQLGVCNIVTQ